MTNGQYVDYNPYFAILKASKVVSSPSLSLREYYSRYGTTEEKDGWKMTNPTGNQVVYVK